MDGVRLARLRWRLRGAWQWPLFAVLVPLEALLLERLPVSGDGPGGYIPAFLLAGFANLFVVAALAPPGGWLLRRRRPDLPRPIAKDYAGSALLVALAAGLLTAGFVHRPKVLEQRSDERAQFAAVHVYVNAQAPEYRGGLAAVSSIRLGEDLYRACVPGPDLPLCLFVDTGQHPPGVTRDRERIPNEGYQR